MSGNGAGALCCYCHGEMPGRVLGRAVSERLGGQLMAILETHTSTGRPGAEVPLTVKQGDIVSALEGAGDTCLVRLRDGRQGYVPFKILAVIEDKIWSRQRRIDRLLNRKSSYQSYLNFGEHTGRLAATFQSTPDLRRAQPGVMRHHSVASITPSSRRRKASRADICRACSAHIRRLQYSACTLCKRKTVYLPNAPSLDDIESTRPAICSPSKLKQSSSDKENTTCSCQKPPLLHNGLMQSLGSSTELSSRDADDEAELSEPDSGVYSHSENTYSYTENTFLACVVHH